MDTPHEMTTLSEVMEKLRLKKMDNEFRLEPTGFTTGNKKYYAVEDLVIVKVFRFEGYTDPGDMAVLYVIRANDGLLGYSLGAYGTYSNHEKEKGYDNFIRQIPIVNHDLQLLFEI